MIFQNVPKPPISQPIETAEPTDVNGRKSAFATMRDLSQSFCDAGLDTEQVWEFIKAENSVETRSKLTALQWVKIAAQLQSARRDAEMFKIFVDGIPDAYFRIRVITSDANVCIGRPNITEQHIGTAWGDFQMIATENRCEVKVTQGKKITYYKPARLSVPVDKPVEKRIDKPVEKHVVSLDTNARGETLSVFGTVIEVR